MASEDNSWRTPQFRQNVVSKIEDSIKTFNLPSGKNSVEMENQVFQKAKTKEEYLGFVARLILHVQNKKIGNMPGGPGNQSGPGITDPINALQNLASQGSRNPMMGMGGPMGANAGPMASSGPVNQQMSQNPASNLLQTLNQRPNQGILNGMPGMPNKLPGMQMGGPNPMGQMPGPNSSGMCGANQMGPGGTNPIGNQMGGGNLPGQMQGGPQSMPGGNNGPITNQQMLAQIQQQNQLQNQLNQQMQNQQGVNPMMGPGGNMPGQMNPQMQGGGPQMQNHHQLINQLSSGPGGAGGPNQQMQNMLSQQQMQHLAQQRASCGPGVNFPRGISPNQQYMSMGGGPHPSGPHSGMNSPAGNQMIPSPALIPSPSNQQNLLGGPGASPAQRMNLAGMTPSPGSSLNTPLGAGAGGQQVPSASPIGVGQNIDDQAYREKVRQLSKYCEPLRKMIQKCDNGEKLLKLKRLLEILSTQQRVPLETLLKCEVVLEKMDLKRSDGSVPSVTVKDYHTFNPLVDALNNCLQSPLVNHTLHRTFGPTMDALNGPEIKSMPPPLKRKKTEQISNSGDIPDVLQGEIARLDSRFKVALDPIVQHHGSGGSTNQTTSTTTNLSQTANNSQTINNCSVQLICWLDDKHLPCVPPVMLTIPEDYPRTSPTCHMSPHEYNATKFLSTVQKVLLQRIGKLPKQYSVSQMLDTWEMSVRQACSPNYNASSISTTSVCLGL